MDTQEQQVNNITNNLVENKPKAPILVKIIGWLLLLSGIGYLLLSGPLLLLGGAGRNVGLLGTGGFYLLSGVGFVAVAIGLRNLRKWALYVYTVLALSSVVYIGYDLLIGKGDIRGSIAVILQVLVLIYLWAIRRRFN